MTGSLARVMESWYSREKDRGFHSSPLRAGSLGQRITLGDSLNVSLKPGVSKDLPFLGMGPQRADRGAASSDRDGRSDCSSPLTTGLPGRRGQTQNCSRPRPARSPGAPLLPSPRGLLPPMRKW